MSEPSYRLGILISTGSAFLGRGLALVAGIILFKILVPESLGRFTSDQALVFIGAGLINLGIGQGYRQIVSRNPELRNSYLLPTIVIRLCGMLVYFAGLVVYLNYVRRWDMQTILVVLGTLVFSLMELFEIDLQIARSYAKVAILTLGRSLVIFLAAIICWQANAKYSYLAVSYFALALLVIVVGWLIVRPAGSSILRFEYRKLIKTSIPFSAALFAYGLTTFWGLTYIREILGDEQAGYYSVPLKVYQIALIVGMSITAVTIPLYHKLAISKDFGTYAEVFGRLIRGMWFICGPIVGVCYFIPEFIIRVLAREQYLVAAPIFPWIGFGIMLRLLTIPASNILESVDKQWYRVAIHVIGATICMLGVSFVVPRWGIVGAAWTLFGVDLWLMLAHWFASHRFAPKVVSYQKLFVPCLLLVAVMLLISRCLGVSAWVKLLVFCGLWIVYVTICLGFKKELRNIWCGVLRPR